MNPSIVRAKISNTIQFIKSILFNQSNNQVEYGLLWKYRSFREKKGINFLIDD